MGTDEDSTTNPDKNGMGEHETNGNDIVCFGCPFFGYLDECSLDIRREISKLDDVYGVVFMPYLANWIWSFWILVDGTKARWKNTICFVELLDWNEHFFCGVYRDIRHNI